LRACSAAVWELEVASITCLLGHTAKMQPPNHAPLKTALGVLIFGKGGVHEVGTVLFTVSA